MKDWQRIFNYPDSFFQILSLFWSHEIFFGFFLIDWQLLTWVDEFVVELIHKSLLLLFLFGEAFGLAEFFLHMFVLGVLNTIWELQICIGLGGESLWMSSKAWRLMSAHVAGIIVKKFQSLIIWIIRWKWSIGTCCFDFHIWDIKISIKIKYIH